MSDIKKGVYILGDDRVLDLIIAFLNSFRSFNPNLNLCLIPYNNNCKQLISLRDEYNFSVFENQDLLEYFDEVSLNFHDEKKGQYRKLAIWEGDFDEFIYIDIDTLVLSNMDFAFNLLDEFDFITASSNIPHIVKWVWHKSIYNANILSEEQISFGANTGFLTSKKSALNLETIKSKLEKSYGLSKYMNLYCMEQPFLNYLIVTSELNYTSLYVLSNTEKYKYVKIEKWAGAKNGKIKDGIIQFDDDQDVLFLHWAGKWQVYKNEARLVRIKNILTLNFNKKVHTISHKMPYRKLWDYYRNLDL